MEKLYRINEVARELRVSVKWLQDAEKIGKIPKAKRDLNNWRVYIEEDIELLRQLLVPRNEARGDC